MKKLNLDNGKIEEHVENEDLDVEYRLKGYVSFKEEIKVYTKIDMYVHFKSISNEDLDRETEVVIFIIEQHKKILTDNLNKIYLLNKQFFSGKSFNTCEKHSVIESTFSNDLKEDIIVEFFKTLWEDFLTNHFYKKIYRQYNPYSNLIFRGESTH